MKHSAAEILREYGPFPGVDHVHGVTYDGQHVWFAAGDTLNAIDPASGKLHRSIDVAAHAGTAFDGEHLAYLERTRGTILDCLKRDPRVCIMYVNMKAQRDGKMESGFLRFYGTAELYESGPVREAIFRKLSKREQEHDGADKGIGVLIKIARAADVRGKPLP